MGNQKKKVFISHASADKSIITNFVEQVLILGLGLKQEESAYTSEEPLGVIPGENITTYIKDNIDNASLVLIMISPCYKSSEICLNEMGAAWALNKKCISVVLPGANFDQLGWLTSMEKAVRMTDTVQINLLCSTIAQILAINLHERYTYVTNAVDKFIGTLKEEVVIPTFDKKQNTIKVTTESLIIFDSSFLSLYLEEGKYIIQLTIRMRSDMDTISIKRILIRNKYRFSGSLSHEIREFCFKSYMHPDTFDLLKQQDKAEDFVMNTYKKECRLLLDTVIEKEHNFSCSFIELFYTIRQSDGYDELQLNGWELVVEYNVDGEAVIPLTINPVDKDPRGKYWNNSFD